MPVLNAYLSQSSGYFTGWSTNLSAELNDIVQTTDFSDTYSPYVLWSARTWALPVSTTPVEKDAYITKSFLWDYYFRVYVLPSSINAGNVVSNQERDITFWNAWPYDDVGIEAAGVVGDAGTVMTLPPGVSLPHTAPALQELTFKLTITLAGPPTISAGFTLTVDGQDYVVPISGRRVILFHFRPQWRSYIDETLTFRSWVIEAEDGTEQTGETCGTDARRTFEYRTVAKNALEAQRMENMLFAWQNRFFGFPIWTERKRLLADVLPGDTEMDFDKFGFTVAAGSLVAVFKENSDIYEVREVEALTAGGVSLTTPFVNAWAEGDEVFPVAIGYMDEDVSVSRETTTVGVVPVTFNCEPLSTPSNIPDRDAVSTYSGFELLIDKINWRGALPTGFRGDRKVLDYGTGRVTMHSRTGWAKAHRVHNWQLLSAAEVDEFRAFLGRRRGLAVPVWMTSGMHDFTVAATSLSSQNHIVVAANEYLDLVNAHPARRHICIQFNDGTHLARRIESVAQDGSNVRLFIGAALGRDISPANVKRVSYLHQYRFASPAIVLRHLADRRVEAEARMVTRINKEDAP